MKSGPCATGLVAASKLGESTAYILSFAAKKLGYDLILCGKQSIDGDTAQVGPMLSEFLKCKLITNALEIKATENEVTTITREGDETAKLPAQYNTPAQ